MAAPVPTPNWTHSAEVVRVVDGDTFVARIDLGRYPTKIHATATIRIAGLWSPEKDEKGGPEATAALMKLLFPEDARPDEPVVVLQTRKPDPRDPYGRVVADVWVDGIGVAEQMISEGHGTAEKR